MKNVCYFFGVNGSGKTCIANNVKREIKDSVVINGSQVLRNSLGEISREELEQMSAYSKHKALCTEFLRLFDEHKNASVILCDTHLVVPIYKNNEVYYENMWDSIYKKFTKTFIYLMSPVETILYRRIVDMSQKKRKRDILLSRIEADQDINIRTFNSLFGNLQQSHIIVNEGEIERAVKKVLVCLKVE